MKYDNENLKKKKQSKLMKQRKQRKHTIHREEQQGDCESKEKERLQEGMTYRDKTKAK